MDLIDRYLAAVRRHLPRPQQDDIIQELSDSLRSEAEDREHETGHALTDAEQAALLKKRGHPWLMAAKFSTQQYLIGPALFPYYKQTLPLVLFWVVLPITAVTFLVSGVSSGINAHLAGKVIAAIWNGTIYSVGIVTSVFYALEQQRVRFTSLDNWDPASLPDQRDGRAIPRSETVASLVFGLIFLMWWTGLVRFPDLSPYAGTDVTLVALPIWQLLYVPVLVLSVASMAVSLVDIVRPWRTLAVSMIDIAINAANAILLVWVVQQRPQFFDVIGDAAHAERLTRLGRFLNGGLTWGLVVVAAVIVLDILYEIWQISRPHTAIKSALL